MRRRHVIIVGIIALFGLTTLLVGCGKDKGNRDIETVSVPNVVGMTLQEAEAELSKAGLVAYIMNTGMEKPSGTERVTNQDMWPNTEVQKGREIGLTLIWESSNGESTQPSTPTKYTDMSLSEFFNAKIAANSGEYELSDLAVGWEVSGPSSLSFTADGRYSNNLDGSISSSLDAQIGSGTWKIDDSTNTIILTGDSGATATIQMQKQVWPANPSTGSKGKVRWCGDMSGGTRIGAGEVEN